MATFAYTYTIANGQKADATPVQQNLNDARTFMLNSCWHSDGTNGFSRSAIISQNTKSPLRTQNVQYDISFDSVVANAWSMWSSTAPTLFTCQSTGFYSIDLQIYTVDPTESYQNYGFVIFQNNTTSFVAVEAINAPGASLGGFSLLTYLTLNDVFKFAYNLTLIGGYAVSATASICQVGR